ncbi:MAG: hypothetical protein IH612_21135, partial [Desulfofustis sp.]|nr:hypothetical protein [Desulfofustis sp.]
MNSYRHGFIKTVSLFAGFLICLLTVNPAFAGVCSIDASAGGGTYIEAEHFTTVGTNFNLESTKTGFNGTGYLLATSGSTNNVTGTPYQYNVNFPSAGVYYLWVRGHSENSDNKNSLYYGLDGTPVGNFAATVVNSWAWANVRQSTSPYVGTNPISITVPTAGAHSIYFWSRESGYYFDGFFVTKDSTVSISQTATIPTIGNVINPRDPGNDSCAGASIDPLDIDNDLDGYTENQGDCNDAVAAIRPGASECNPDGTGDLIDNNCNLVVDEGCYADLDGDGYASDVDCNDGNAAIHPGASEICGDGIDGNCDGVVDENCDIDHDGYTVDDGDCRDDRADIHPNAIEICGDLVDNDCANGVDDGCDTATVVDGGLVAQVPLILKAPVKPQVMLDMSNDHQLYFT